MGKGCQLVAGILCGFVAFAQADAQAQDYPSRPITLIVPFAAGGSTDVIARVVGEAMHRELGQPVIKIGRAHV